MEGIKGHANNPDFFRAIGASPSFMFKTIRYSPAYLSRTDRTDNPSRTICSAR